MAQLRRSPGAFSTHPRAVFRFQIFQHIILAFAQNHEMPARKGFIVNFHVRRRVPAYGQRSAGQFPPLSNRSDIIQQAQARHNRNVCALPRALLGSGRGLALRTRRALERLHNPGPRAVLGSQRTPTRKVAQIGSGLPLRSNALRAEDGSRSVPFGRHLNTVLSCLIDRRRTTALSEICPSRSGISRKRLAGLPATSSRRRALFRSRFRRSRA